MNAVQGVPSELRMGFVDLNFDCSSICLTAWADGNFSEVAGQLGKMVEHRNQSQPNPGLSSLGTPCTNMPFFVRDMPLIKPFLLSTLFGSIVPSSAMRAFSLISFLFS